VNQCFIGHVLSDRLDRAVTCEVRRQQRHIQIRWNEERTATAGTLYEHLLAPGTVDLLPILTELRNFSHGLEALAQAWHWLGQAIRQRGFLSPHEWVTGVRLMGVLPTTDAVGQHQDSFLFTLWSARCNPATPAGMIETLLQPAYRPAGLEDLGRDELLPDPAACREQLTRCVDHVLTELRARADRVAREVNGPELARLLKPADVVLDPDKAKRFDRARSNYRSTYYPALKALESRREAEAAGKTGPPRSGPAPGPDIKPPTADGGIAAGPSGVSQAVTEVVCQQPEEAPAEGQEAVLQNGAQTGPERAAAHHRGACRSYHQQVAKRPVAAVVPVHSHQFDHGAHRPRKE
jgi:hypothetical protein